MPARDWIQSFSSKVVTPRDLRPDQVTFEDIAHALAQKVRFNGQLAALGYSVAQHCVMGAEQIAGPFKLAFLLHEVSEVYLPDVPTPIKSFLSVDIGGLEGLSDKCLVSWAKLEEIHADVIFAALGLRSIRPLIDAPEVRLMDLRMLMTEKRDMASPEPQPWGIDVEPLGIQIRPWSATESERRFIESYYRLTGNAC